MTSGQWPGQDGPQGQPGQQGWPGGGGVVPPQWHRERQDSTRQLAWYGQPGYEKREQEADGNGRWQPPQPQPQPDLLPAWRPEPGQRGFNPPPPQPPYRPQPPRGKSWPARHKVLTGCLAFAALVLIIGAANAGRSPSSPGNGTKAGLTGTASATATGSPSHHATATATAPKATATARQAPPEKTQPAAPATSPVPATTAAAPAPTAHAPSTTAPAPTTSAAAAPPPPSSAAPAGCHPLTNGGNCYEPGEFCRVSDHGVSGVTGDGEPITCEDNDGWRWEPS